jgi:undecaprenyl pyrophosphate phosphatase UppP
MTTHLGVMILFATCVAAVFGTLLRDTPAEQLRFGGRILTALVLGAYLLGWIMYIAF